VTKQKFDRNKPFNDLPLLPPKLNLDNDPQVLKKLVSASRALASVDGNIKRLPNPYMLVNTIALQEARTSTEIENIFTTEDELYKAITDNVKESKANFATKEVLRYREAMWAGYRSIKDIGTINLQSIVRISQQVKDTSQGIRTPQSRVVIKRGQSEFRAGEVIYTPPRGEGIVEKLMQNLIEFLNNDEKFPMDPLLKMCIAHYQFEVIHPFMDGNGRTGRILNLLYLVHKNLLSHPTLYLSKYIIVYKDDYYYKLSTVTNRSKWKDWVIFMLDAVEKTSGMTNNLISEILEQMDTSLKYGKKHLKWYSKELNEAIFSQPYIKPKVIKQVIGKSSRTTITKYMGELVKAGILSHTKDGAEVYYINNELIRILEQ